MLNFQNCKDLSYEGSQKHGLVGVEVDLCVLSIPASFVQGMPASAGGMG